MDSLFMIVDSLKLINDINKIKIYDNFLQKETCDHILKSIEEDSETSSNQQKEEKQITK